MSISKTTLRSYYYLTKPGIIYGNILYATAGFLLASKGHINFSLLLAMLAGTSLGIASACVFNNYLDRDIDMHMARTKKRALVQKTIPVKNALIYAFFLGALGFGTLALLTNWLTVVIGATGFVVYVFLYTFSKRRTVYSTLIGSVSGAAPPVAGYCAVTNRFDGAAMLLFLILTFWQMPHFYAIAIYRIKDYKAAKIPVLPLVAGIRATKIQIVLYITAYTIAVAMLSILGYTGYSFLLVVGLVSLVWFRKGLAGFKHKDDEIWARGVFKYSLVVTLVFSFMLAVNAWLP